MEHKVEAEALALCYVQVLPPMRQEVRLLWVTGTCISQTRPPAA
jgi:hypothetical protein